MREFYNESARILETLRSHSQTLATAESLSGGLLGATLTQVPGSSDVYLGGVIAYDVKIKRELLSVAPELITQHGVVSSAVALAMAVGVCARTGSDWSISTTGVAGPGPSDGVPAGRVWIAVSGPNSLNFSEELSFSGDRDQVRMETIARALAAFTRILGE